MTDQEKINELICAMEDVFFVLMGTLAPPVDYDVSIAVRERLIHLSKRLQLLRAS